MQIAIGQYADHWPALRDEASVRQVKIGPVTVRQFWFFLVSCIRRDRNSISLSPSITKRCRVIQ
jgi:hypothetical protein